MSVMEVIKKSIDDWLNSVDYGHLNSADYLPSEFALTFMNFIKLVNGVEGESHKTPPVHLAMLDKIVGPKKLIANLVFRGAAKTTLFAEYLFLFIGVFGYLPGFGRVEGALYVADTVDNGAKNLRKSIEARYWASEFLQEWMPPEGVTFTDAYIEFRNKDGLKFGFKLYGAKSGIRGTKIFAKRPVLCVLDDLLSDEDARSKTVLEAIKSTIYKGVFHALDPTRRKIIFNGTPFNKEDPLIEAVESGAWDVNVWPVCERFPCTEEEFIGAWPDRFTYEFVKDQYDTAVLTGKLPAFNQELMLRLTSEDERLVQDEEIRWYSRQQLLKNKHNFNFYITTDLATSEKQKADYSVISVWAYNANADWFWVDGMVERQTIDKTFNRLFELVQEYKPQQVGIEVSGQQQAYIKLLEGMMLQRNIWFNFASSDKTGTPGIRPTQDKLARFNLVVPWFKTGKIHFPEEIKTSTIIGHFTGQIALATHSGLKGKDDCLDTISMLGYLSPWKPAESVLPESLIGHNGGPSMFDEQGPQEAPSALSSYIV